MATLGEDKYAKISTEGLFTYIRLCLPECCATTINTYISLLAAGDFVEKYYPALHNARETIASFYMQPTTLADGKSLPVIIFNGDEIEGPVALQTMFKEEMPESRYEIDTYDCHILNPHYVPENTPHTLAETGKNMIIMIAVTGEVKYGDKKNAPDQEKIFSDNIVLVPNPVLVEKEREKPAKEWLIQSQNFRFV